MPEPETSDIFAAPTPALAIRRLRLRLLAGADETAVGDDSSWRDDLRLFGITWAFGFLFFLIVIA